MTAVWCVKWRRGVSEFGWCVCKINRRFGAAVVSLKTKCDHHVILPLGCEECIELLG